MGKSSSIVNLLYLISPIPFGLLFVLAVSFGALNAFVYGMVLGFTSFVFLLIAKAPALRSGRVFTFGARAVPPARRWLWWAAGALLAASVPFFVASAIAHAQF